MIHGLDTGFLVAVEVAEHAGCQPARARLGALISSGDTFALAPQVLAEFVHVVTDAKRFTQPLDMTTALGLAEKWWTAREVTPALPSELATRQFIVWMKQFALGRKRVLDTLLAATYLQCGVSSILTTNPPDFTVFGCFQCITPHG